MTARTIATLIPPRARPGGRERGRPGPARPLPVADAPAVPVVPDDVVYGFGRMDEWGRVADRAITGVLGWQRGDRLTLTGAGGVVTARRDPAGLVTMAAKPYLVIPAALRRRCGLRVLPRLDHKIAGRRAVHHRVRGRGVLHLQPLHPRCGG
jgi:hypothetical protein